MSFQDQGMNIVNIWEIIVVRAMSWNVSEIEKGAHSQPQQINSSATKVRTEGGWVPPPSTVKNFSRVMILVHH